MNKTDKKILDLAKDSDLGDEIISLYIEKYGLKALAALKVSIPERFKSTLTKWEGGKSKYDDECSKCKQNVYMSYMDLHDDYGTIQMLEALYRVNGLSFGEGHRNMRTLDLAKKLYDATHGVIYVK